MLWEFKCPPQWELVDRWGDGYICYQKSGGLRVIIDCETKSDGFQWIHVSVSRKSWTPTHEDMVLVKRDFIGEELYAYSIWPPKENYVNIHNHCLHLWAKIDGSNGRVLPEFSEVIEGIGRSI